MAPYCIHNLLSMKKRPALTDRFFMAERTGFEPAIELPQYTLSKRAPSATRPPLQYHLLYQLYNLRPSYGCFSLYGIPIIKREWPKRKHQPRQSSN